MHICSSRIMASSAILAELKQMFGDLPMDASALAAGMPATDGIPTTVSDLKEIWKRIQIPVAIYEFYRHKEVTWGAFIAIQAVTQKFRQCVHLQHCLAATERRIIAETVATDCNWATSSNPLESGNDLPCSWRGLNILGFAMIVARYILKAKGSQMHLPLEEHHELHRLLRS